jgi:hypothetical protein
MKLSILLGSILFTTIASCRPLTPAEMATFNANNANRSNPSAGSSTGTRNAGAAPTTNGSSSSEATCCVNHRHYTCPSMGAAAACLGQPMKLMDCFGTCNGSGMSCEQSCNKQYGPDPSGCHSDGGGC